MRSLVYVILSAAGALWALSVVVPAASGDVYTSVQELSQLFSAEKKIVDALHQYVEKAERRIHKIKTYMEDFEKIRSQNLVGDELDEEELAGNPLQAFHLMKRLTIDLKNLLAPYEDWKGVEEALKRLKHEPFLHFPVEEDLQGAAKGLLRLQTTYKLDTKTLSKGNVLGIPTSIELRAQDCLYMGKHSFNLGLYPLSIEWFEEAYALALREKNATVSPNQVSGFLDVAIKEMEENLKSTDGVKDTTLQLLTNNGFNPAMTVKGRIADLELDSNEYTLGKIEDSWHDLKNYDALCRGEQLLSDKYMSTLSCFYSSRGSPYYKLMPLKVERKHHQPELLVFHDIISDAEIKELKEIAKPYLSRGMVVGGESGSTVSNVRTSKVAWINDFDHSLVERLNARIEAVTGLSTSLDRDDEHAEIMQIANYGTGGHYSGHFDFLFALKTEEEMEHYSAEDLGMGDRIATFMFYLSDVLRGGATVFPKLGVTLWPKKGSAAFWFNLKKSGEGERRTLHGGCPVVYGSKWVSNKWIRMGGQFQRKLCGLHPDD